MSNKFFEPAEFETRQQRVRTAMEKQQIDLLLVISPININYLIGSTAKSYQSFQCLFFPLERGPLTIMLRMSDVAEVSDLSLATDVRGWGGLRYEDPMDLFARVVAEKNLGRMRIGLETPTYYLSVAHYLKIRSILESSSVIDATKLIEDLRLVKSPAELEFIRKAAAIADVGAETISNTIKEGLSEYQVAAEAHKAMMAMGGDSPPSTMNFVSGERTCYAHGAPSDRVLRNGDFIHAEFGGAYRRYCSVIARHYCVGKPTSRMIELHNWCREACDAAFRMIKAGVPAEKPHLAAKQVLKKAGLDSFNLHFTGCGIAPGFPPSWTESLTIFDHSMRTLETGMVISVEPPIFIHKERLGARLIDCVIVKNDGAELLSKFSRDIIY